MSHAFTALLGGTAAIAALAVHRSGPLFLLLAVVASVATAYLFRATSHPRLAASYAGSWLLVVGVASVGRREGDYVLAADVAGYTLTGAAFLLVVIGVTSLKGGRQNDPA